MHACKRMGLASCDGANPPTHPPCCLPCCCLPAAASTQIRSTTSQPVSLPGGACEWQSAAVGDVPAWLAAKSDCSPPSPSLLFRHRQRRAPR